MRESVTVGAIDLSPALQVRLTICQAHGKRVIDIRSFDLFAGVWMPNKKGVSIPVEHAEAVCRLADAAAAAVGAKK